MLACTMHPHTRTPSPQVLTPQLPIFFTPFQPPVGRELSATVLRDFQLADPVVKRELQRHGASARFEDRLREY